MIDDTTLSVIPFKGDVLVKETLAEHLNKKKLEKEQQDALTSQRESTTEVKMSSPNKESPIRPTDATPEKTKKENSPKSDSDLSSEEGPKFRFISKGELKERMWSSLSVEERQPNTVLKQIGLEPDTTYSEEELEEYIILKAVRDFNHSKFATEEHIMIEGIIKDIF